MIKVAALQPIDNARRNPGVEEGRGYWIYVAALSVFGFFFGCGLIRHPSWMGRSGSSTPGTTVIVYGYIIAVVMALIGCYALWKVFQQRRPK